MDESSAVTVNQCADSIDLSMPASRTDDHVLARRNAGLDMANDTRGSGEIDHDVDSTELFWVECSAGSILDSARYVYGVATPARDLRHQRSRLSAA